MPGLVAGFCRDKPDDTIKPTTENARQNGYPRRRCAGSGVAQRRMPVGPSTCGCQVEEVPERVDGVAMAHVLAGLWLLVEQLGAPGVADHAAFSAEDVEHRLLLRAAVALTEVVAVVGVARRRQEAHSA